MSVLFWSVHDDEMRFTCTAHGEEIPVEQWAVHQQLTTSTGASARVAPLLAALESEVGTVDQNAICVPAEWVSTLSPSELTSLGLPPAAPFSVRLDKTGLLTDPQFSVRSTLLAPGGRPLIGGQLSGPILTAMGRQFTVLSPLFQILRSTDAVNRAASLEQRAPHLQELHEWIPADALVDPYLRTIHVGRADSFSLAPRLGASGEIDFDIRPVRRQQTETIQGSQIEHKRVLPEAREEEWNRHFRALPTVRETYPAGAGHYIVVSKALQKALETVKSIQRDAPAVRAAFVRNPQAFLKDRLGESMPEETLESLFWESGEYGERVREVGAWQPKVLPYARRTGNTWLPDEEMGLQIGTTNIRIKPGDAARLLQDVIEARDRGRPSIPYGDATIPATDQTIDALKALEALANREPDSKERATSAQGTSARIAILISDNLDALEFERSRSTRPGTVGTLPSCLRSSLFPFQAQGTRWLQELWTMGAAGGLLADDMGLGKTVQALTFLAWVRELQRQGAVPHRPMLVVAPTGLLTNWIAEHGIHLSEDGLGHLVEAYGDRLRALRPSGSHLSELRTGIPFLDIDAVRSADWVLTTYETLRAYQHSFGRIRWSVLVLDETQKVKNPATLVTEAIKALEGEFTVGLTGTPVENHLADLWCITDTVQPGRLGDLKSFVSTYQPDGPVDVSRLQRLKQVLEQPPPVMLRRMKDEQLRGLPSITYHVQKIPMPAVQADAYDAAIAVARRAAGSRSGMLEALQQLRAVSLHPLREFGGDDEAFISSSARLIECCRVLDEIHGRAEKALVFVEALALQGILAELFQRRYSLATPPLIINGSVQGSRRKARADAFQARPGFDVMIVSPRAAGVGLTITAANHVIHLSRWWNPAVEDQSTDRVYRIGQKRPVEVHIPLAVHSRLGDSSFDVQLNELLVRKRALSRDLLGSPAASESELEGLYKGTVQP